LSDQCFASDLEPNYDFTALGDFILNLGVQSALGRILKATYKLTAFTAGGTFNKWEVRVITLNGTARSATYNSVINVEYDMPESFELYFPIPNDSTAVSITFSWVRLLADAGSRHCRRH
jgi:hypothetical protein